MHLYNDGHVDSGDLDGVSFERGSSEALFETARKVAYREGFGDALADGPVTLARKLGKKAEEYLYHNQGLTLRTFEFRAEPGTALGEVVAARGNSLRATTYHVVLWDKPASEGYAGVDPKERDASYQWSRKMFGTEKAIMATEYEGKPAALIYEMNGAAVADSLGYCVSMIRPGRTGAPGSQFGDTSYQFAADRFKAATGLDVDEAALLAYGERVCNLERAIVIRDGRTKAMETLPDFFFKTPIPDGVQAGKMLNKDLFEKMKEEYYALRGWDPETGMQREPTLSKLGMADVARELKKAKKLAPEKAAKEA
jgi:aldehyde:ferredoxin oxidoreductase